MIFCSRTIEVLQSASSTRGRGEAAGAPELEPGAEAEEAEDTQMKKLSSELRTFNQSAEVRATNEGSRRFYNHGEASY